MRNLLIVFAGSLMLAGCSTNPGQNDGGGLDAGADIGPVCDANACPSKHCAPTGDCAPGCQTSNDCASGETCCNSSYCSNLSKDPQNCGACGTVCGAKQFCSGSACTDALVKNVCQNAAGTVVLDNLDVDDTAGSTVGSTLGGACKSMQIAQAPQGSPGTMDSASGRPTTGPGNAYIATGGGFAQKAIQYMNDTHDAPVVTMGDGTNVSFIRTSDGSTVVTSPTAALTNHHDFFVVYAAAEPVSGTLVFAVYGLYSAGTTAGSVWLKAQDLSTLTKQYYVFQWDDTNNNGVPDPPNTSNSDTYKLLDSN